MTQYTNKYQKIEKKNINYVIIKIQNLYYKSKQYTKQYT